MSRNLDLMVVSRFDCTAYPIVHNSSMSPHVFSLQAFVTVNRLRDKYLIRRSRWCRNRFLKIVLVLSVTVLVLVLEFFIGSSTKIQQ